MYCVEHSMTELPEKCFSGVVEAGAGVMVAWIYVVYDRIGCGVLQEMRFRKSLDLARQLIVAMQTSGAYIEPFRFPLNCKRCRLNIGQPTTSGMLFRMAYIISEVYSFSTYIAFPGQVFASLADKINLTKVVK